jgi:WD40 repeat protein
MQFCYSVRSADPLSLSLPFRAYAPGAPPLAGIISSIDFNVSEDLFATAAVSKRLTIYRLPLEDPEGEDGEDETMEGEGDPFSSAAAAAAAGVSGRVPFYSGAGHAEVPPGYPDQDAHAHQNGGAGWGYGRRGSGAGASNPNGSSGTVVRGIEQLAEYGTRSKLSCVSWSRADRALLGCSDYDGSVVLWDVATGHVTQEYEAHDQRIWSLDFCRVRGGRTEHDCFELCIMYNLIKK